MSNVNSQAQRKHSALKCAQLSFTSKHPINIFNDSAFKESCCILCDFSSITSVSTIVFITVSMLVINADNELVELYN